MVDLSFMSNISEKANNLLSGSSNYLSSNYFIVAVIIAVLAIVAYFTTGYISKSRIYYASKFGKIEHKSGRILGLLLIITFFLEYFNTNYTVWGIIGSFICWVVYLLSHTIEKYLYPSNFRF